MIELSDSKPTSTTDLAALEATPILQGPIIDRFVGRDLTYLIQRTANGFFRFVVLDADRELRYSETMSSNLRGIYMLVLQDCELSYPMYRWWPFADDIGMFRNEEGISGEEYLLSKMIYDQIPELATLRSNREISQLIRKISGVFTQ